MCRTQNEGDYGKCSGLELRWLNLVSAKNRLVLYGLVLDHPLSSDSLEITLEDEDNFVNDFLGFVSILMGDLADKRKMRQW